MNLRPRKKCLFPSKQVAKKTFLLLKVDLHSSIAVLPSKNHVMFFKASYVQCKWTCSKKFPFWQKHWCLHLHLDRSKFDLSRWVILSVTMIKLKDWSFQFWRIHRKQTQDSGDIAILFLVIFMILVERKCILQKWYSFKNRSN